MVQLSCNCGSCPKCALTWLWVYWPPDNLVMWSREAQTWTDILFVTNSELPDEDLSFIQNVELTYIGTAGLTESPYIFKIT